MTLTVLVPIFALLALGFAAARTGLLSAEANGGLLKLVACFAIPALLFRSLAGGAQASGGGEIAVIYLLGCAALLVIAFVYGRSALGLSLAECVVFGMGVIYSNSSLIGIPIAQALLGDQGVALLSEIIAIHTLVLIPVATLLLAFGNSAGGGSKALISAISNPMTLALAAGLVWRRTGLAVPETIDHVIGMLAAAAPALSLIALGATVARVPLPTSFRDAGRVGRAQAHRSPAADLVDCASDGSAPGAGPDRDDDRGAAARDQRLCPGSAFWPSCRRRRALVRARDDAVGHQHFHCRPGSRLALSPATKGRAA